MYSLVLLLHSWTRWLVLALVLGCLGQSGARLRRGQDWDIEDEILARTTMLFFFAQGILGFLLLVELSPNVSAALRTRGGPLQDPSLFRLVVEHPVAMLLAFVVAAYGRRRTRDPLGGPGRHRAWLLALGVSIALLLIRIPWPGTLGGRPWLRFPW
jgi:hypothetical protein